MTDWELEQKLADALKRTAPNDLDSILSHCGVQNGSVMELKEQNPSQNIIDVNITKGKPMKKLGRWLVAACVVLALAGGGGVYYHQSYAVASVVSLDVNPSIELKVSRNEKVISCAALNTEAAAVLFDMAGGADLKGAKLDVAVNAIVGALVREGYLDSISSAILISVEDNDQTRAARLQQELVASVDGVLRTQAPNTSVLSQVLTADAGAGYMNYDSGVSAGKAALVQKVMEMSGAGNDAFERLAVLSVEELNDLLEAGETRIPIGKNTAALAVEEYAGTLALSSATTDVDPELDEVPPHYEVELKTAWGEFEYIVDAFTGQILSGQKDILNQTPAGQDVPVYPDSTPSDEKNVWQTPENADVASGTVIDQETAKKAALDHAGLTEGQVTNWKIEQDWDDGRLEYEIEFWCGTTEYDYTIDGHSCSILKHEWDHHNEGSHHNEPHRGGSSGGGTNTAAGDIGAEAAKAAALSHAGVAESQATKMEVEQDWDDGRLEYEVEFKSGGMEYEYTIDGTTGAILEYEREYDD